MDDQHDLLEQYVDALHELDQKIDELRRKFELDYALLLNRKNIIQQAINQSIIFIEKNYD